MALICETCIARASDLCGAFAGGEIAVLDAIAVRLRVDAGGYLFHEEASAEFVYNISSGMGLLERLASDGRRQIMSFTQPGDFIGLSPTPVYRISACALTEMTACRWRIGDLEALFGEHPELERRLRLIANRVLATTLDQVFVLGRRNANEKLAYLLLYLAERQARIFGASDEVWLPMTRGDIADYLGVTVETASRTFSVLRRKGLIALPAADRVVLADRAGLAELADREP